MGKSALDIPSYILKATREDVKVYVERERFYICWMKCYQPVQYQNALRKVEEISVEIQKDYQSDQINRSASKDKLKNQEDCQRLKRA